MKKMKKTLYIIRGVSGCGKSHLGEKFQHVSEFAGYSCSIHTADDYFVDNETGEYNFVLEDLGKAHAWCRNKFQQSVSEGTEVIIVNNTGTKYSDIKFYKEVAEENDYEVVSMIIENRHGGTNVHNVPEETLERQEMLLRNNIKLR